MIIDLILFVIKVYQFFDLIKLKYIGKKLLIKMFLFYISLLYNKHMKNLAYFYNLLIQYLPKCMSDVTMSCLSVEEHDKHAENWLALVPISIANMLC